MGCMSKNRPAGYMPILDICHKHTRFSIALSSKLSQEPPLVVSCARTEIYGGLFA